MNEPVLWPSKPRTRGHRYFCFSAKNGTWLGYFSTLEYERGAQHEFDPEVVLYRPNPVWAWAIIDGARHESVPDFYVKVRSDTNVYEEVKYLVNLLDPESRAHHQIAVQRQWCEQEGFTHRVVTEADVWKNPTLISNYLAILPVFGNNYTELIREAKQIMPRITETVQRWPGVRFGDLLDLIDAQMHMREVVELAVCEMVRTGALDAGLERIRFSPNSGLFLGKESPV